MDNTVYFKITIEGKASRYDTVTVTDY